MNQIKRETDESVWLLKFKGSLDIGAWDLELTLVPEMANAREDHGHVAIVRRSGNFFVTD